MGAMGRRKRGNLARGCRGKPRDDLARRRTGSRGQHEREGGNLKEAREGAYSSLETHAPSGIAERENFFA